MVRDYACGRQNTAMGWPVTQISTGETWYYHTRDEARDAMRLLNANLANPPIQPLRDRKGGQQ